ncbi:MAG TPA: SpoIID/LytB domain-containing protein [Thermoanaerobacterales bacterium]|nr:SpoIID/LytB domain-containing protein [Thermoanaerobacterales bacterium]
MNIKSKKLSLFILTIFTIMSLSCNGCMSFFGSTSSKKPTIPESISKGSGKEPELTVYIKDDEKIEKMNIEDYITGVVAGEMKNDWPVEALAAQAILARTYVLEFIESKGGSKYGNAHISTDIEEAQAWDTESINDRIREAVASTKGTVASYKGDYIKAWFHAHSGGTTATAKEGLAFKDKEPPYIKKVKSLDSDVGPEEDRDWSAVYTRDEVRSLIKEKIGDDVGEVTSIEVTEKGPSGRAAIISVNGKDFPGADLRIALGSSKMKSTLLSELKIDGEKVTMKGKGYGHGVGMSQWGANAMAERGDSPEDIVKYYFKDIDIIKLWD